MSKDGYHHGNLRSALLAAAAEQIAEDGVDVVSMRALARRCGVSHAAPTHHFGDRPGLFTALAAQGFDLLADDLSQAGPDLVDVGLAYVRSVLSRPGHFDVMFRHDLLNLTDAALLAAQERAAAQLAVAISRQSGDSAQAARRPTRLAAWSIAHGFASLWREGAFGASRTDTTAAEVLARTVLGSVSFDGA
jgi:AcrR family transcriptional regulator